MNLHRKQNNFSLQEERAGGSAKISPRHVTFFAGLPVPTLEEETLKKLLLVSRHRPRPEQVTELEKYYGEEVEIHRFRQTVRDVDQIITAYTKGRYDDLIVVLNMHLLSELTERGVKPLSPRMGRTADFRRGKRPTATNYNHLYFERIIDVHVKSTRIGENP
jgi:hypothetical protein